MAATRGVFALILIVVDGRKTVLLSQRADGKGWNLPGGRVEPGETDYEALVREVREETGLIVEIIEQVGEPHVFGEDTALAFTCKVVGGRLIETAEAVRHYFATKEDVAAGRIRVGMNEGVGMWVALKLVGPEGRLGRMGRMVYDGFSIMEEPVIVPNDAPADYLPITGTLLTSLDDFPIPGIFLSEDKCSLITQKSEGQKKWPRLDPFSPTGKMGPK
jgi:ADP-ribose pyrophosphatase YjhB (NUDIX family)